MINYCLRIKILFAFSIIIGTISAQETYPKKFTAEKITQKIIIDGLLDDVAWRYLPLLEDFIQYVPYNGQKPAMQTIVRAGYDDSGLYFGIYCRENGKDSVMAEISQRDNLADSYADKISIVLNPLNDGINAYRFGITAAGVQYDTKYTESGGERDWDAVWESRIMVSDTGWIAEIKIPFSELRFPDTKMQDWSINIWRLRAITNEWSVWSYIPSDIDGYKVNGIMEQIELSDLPLRLSLTPYISSYIENSTQRKWSASFNAGADLKYGISESFTLDAILIPDFGQVQSDDKILNLSPYEIRYNEKRQFFTEGTELFNKGDIFYSRRIGSAPKGQSDAYDNLSENEIVAENPDETKLINALKLSGRTNKGLGIGILNAIVGNTYATILDTLSGDSRIFVTQPFTNYSLIALDQNLFKNSYLSFINSNVKRNEFSANVSAAEFKIADRDNRYSIKGIGAVSRVVEGVRNSDKGYKYGLEAGKFRGSIQYSFNLTSVSHNYDQNDLGYLSRNNEFRNTFEVGHHIYQPFGSFLNMHNQLLVNYNRVVEPWVFSEFRINYILETTLKNNYYVRMHASIVPVERRDYYEPRVEGRFFRNFKYYHDCITLTSDKRKPLIVSTDIEFTRSYDFDFSVYSRSVNIGPVYRFNDKFNMGYIFSHGTSRNELGYVENTSDGPIIFGKRTIKSITNILSLNYLFSHQSSFNFRLRHYRSQALYDSYFELTEDGFLIPAEAVNAHDINYSTFNVDMTYVWNFAPGSELRINWKNASVNDLDETGGNYWDSLGSVFRTPNANVVSFKLLYYLNYQTIRGSLR